MPQSWVKVPRGTSDRLRACLGGQNTDSRFEHCVHEIVSSHGSSVVEIRHLGHDQFSHVRFDAPHDAAKSALMVDLDAEEIDDPDAHGANPHH